MTPADRLIHAALEQLAPASVLVVTGDSEPGGVQAYRQHRPSCHVTVLAGLSADGIAAEVSGQRFAAAVMTDVERLTDDQTRAIIAVLRDRLSDAIVVVAPDDYWADADWLALGLEAHDRCEHEAGTLVLYRYDIAHFNPEREWNNPRDWAHPENFRRYRW